MGLTRLTPGMARNRTLTTQVARSRSTMGSASGPPDSDTSRISPIKEDSGIMTGWVLGGSTGSSAASRSATNWRAR